MSFSSIFHKIEGVAFAVEPEAASILSVFNPLAGGLLNLIFSSVAKAETTYQADKAGPQKKQLVMDEFTNALPLIQLVLAAFGKTVDPAALTAEASATVDTTVALMNQLAKVQTVALAKGASGPQTPKPAAPPAAPPQAQAVPGKIS